MSDNRLKDSLSPKGRAEGEKLRAEIDKDKMATIARLAGGIAHDFNNLLAVILLHSDLLLTAQVTEATVRRRGREIKKATERAAALTRQLLAFGSRQLMHPRNLDLNNEVLKCRETLTRQLGPNIKLTIRPGDLQGQIKADPIHLEQVITNLAGNARDAMPAGGSLTITTETFYSSDHESGLALPSGSYAKLTFTDTGCGMDAETQSRVFEPFFTTKAPGQGTGLGLSAVYGIVKQFRGEIFLRSQAGQGTSLDIYLPVAAQTTIDSNADQGGGDMPAGTETILLVDDEPLVRNAVSEMLEMCGYNVLVAGSGPKAIEISDSREGPIDLLLTDVSMPGMKGPAVAEEIVRRRPEMRVLFMSGFTDAPIRVEGLSDEDTPFMEKPFTPDALARKIRRMLD